MDLHLFLIGFFTLTAHLTMGARLRHLDKKRILDAHNGHRRDFANGLYGTQVANMNSLTWSATLQKRANELLTCDLARDWSRDYLNVNMGVATGRRFEDVISSWFRGVVHFLPEYQMCFNADECKHFMTMVSANQKFIGCSFKRCGGNRNAFACLYDKSATEVPLYAPGDVCTKCTGTYSFCEDGLCVPCEGESCDCRKTCHKAHVGYGHLNKTTCSCTCEYGQGPNCDEPCKNPEMYLDYDICGSLDPALCSSPDLGERDLIREFCPELCGCGVPTGVSTR